MPRAAASARAAPGSSSFNVSTNPLGEPSAANAKVTSRCSRSLKWRTRQRYGENRRSTTSALNAGLPPPSSSTNVCTVSSSENEAASRYSGGPSCWVVASSRARASASWRSMRMSSDRSGNARVKYRQEKAAEATARTARPIQSAGFLVMTRQILPVRHGERATETRRHREFLAFSVVQISGFLFSWQVVRLSRCNRDHESHHKDRKTLEALLRSAELAGHAV